YGQRGPAGPVTTKPTPPGQNARIHTGGIATSNNCATATDVLNNTQAYAGQQVTITGTIAQVVGPHAVTVAATGNTSGNNAQTLLAVAKDTVPLTPGAPVQVTGTLQPTFDANQATTFTGS